MYFSRSFRTAARRAVAALVVSAPLCLSPFSLSPFSLSPFSLALSTAEAAAPTHAQSPTQSPPRSSDSDVSLYRRLMELNDTARNIRLTLANIRKDLLESVIRARGAPFSPAQQARFDIQADAAFASLTEQVMDVVARDQSSKLTSEDIRTLIAASSGGAAASYYAAAFSVRTDKVDDVTRYIDESVVEIVSTFHDPAIIEDVTVVADGTARGDRRVLAHTLMAVDGTEASVRQTIEKSTSEDVLYEVSEQIDFSELTEDELDLLAELVRASMQKLGSRWLLLGVEAYSDALTTDQLRGLIAAHDTEAQRKLARLRAEASPEADAETWRLVEETRLELATAFDLENETVQPSPTR